MKIQIVKREALSLIGKIFYDNNTEMVENEERECERRTKNSIFALSQQPAAIHVLVPFISHPMQCHQRYLFFLLLFHCVSPYSFISFTASMRNNIPLNFAFEYFSIKYPYIIY